MIYTVTANPSVDYYMEFASLHVGEMNRAGAVWLVPGGKGVNVALVLHRLGLPSCALGFAAGETGGWLRRMLAARGVTCDFLELAGDYTRVNVKLCAETETECNAAGPEVPYDALSALEARVARLTHGDTLVVGGASPRGAAENYYARLLHAANAVGVRTVLDTAGEPLRLALAEHPWLVKPNLQELGELTGTAPRDTASTLRAARSVQQMGARNVLASMGGGGALLLTERGEVWHGAAPQGTLRNTVGAGDSMVAGFLAGFETCGAPQAALRVALAVGSATAFSDWLAEPEALFARIDAQPAPTRMTQNLPSA